MRTGCFQGAIKERVEAGADINAQVTAGTWKGCTCYDLASTEKLRDFIRDLGGGPSRPAVPEYSLEKPNIPRPKTAVRSRHVYTEQEIADLLPDSRRSSALHLSPHESPWKVSSLLSACTCASVATYKGLTQR